MDSGRSRHAAYRAAQVEASSRLLEGGKPAKGRRRAQSARRSDANPAMHRGGARPDESRLRSKEEEPRCRHHRVRHHESRQRTDTFLVEGFTVEGPNARALNAIMNTGTLI